jgi:two-component system CheB/CheR fusion protein
MKPLYDLPAGLTADELLHQLRHHEQARFFEYQRQMRGLLALIRAITRRSAATARSTEEFAAHLEGRLDAVSRVHGILLRLPGAAVDLMELVSGELLAQASRDERVELNGPPVMLSGKAAGSLALALHELTTNAVKFGALAAPAGHLSVRWAWDAGSPLHIRLEWHEHGVSISNEGTRHQGFGMELIERTLPYELKARTSIHFAPDGIRCAIVFDPQDPERPVSDHISHGRHPS